MESVVSQDGGVLPALLAPCAEARFQVSAAEGLRAPFLRPVHPAPTHRVKSLPQAQQAENTGSQSPSPTRGVAVLCQEKQARKAMLPRCCPSSPSSESGELTPTEEGTGHRSQLWGSDSDFAKL